MKMKVREFIKLNTDIDVYDDVCEELGICYCGPTLLTEAGKKHFAEVLDYDIEIDMTGEIWTAAVCVDDDDNKVWRRRLRKAKEFFEALGGYCAADDYDKWFIAPEWGQYATDPDANMYITIYKDATPWYTEEEIMEDNMCELMFPRKMVQEFYISNGGDLNSFVEWIQDLYTADEMDGLYYFCVDRGFRAIREDR